MTYLQINFSESFRSRVLLFLFLFTTSVFTHTYASEQITDSLYREDASKFFNNPRFDFFQDTLIMNIPLKINVANFTGIILSVESSCNAYINMALTYRDGFPEQILFFSKDQIITHSLSRSADSMRADSVLLSLVIDFKKDRVAVQLGQNDFRVSELGFNVNNGYKFFLLPQRQPTINGKEIIASGNPEILISFISKSKYPTWFWYILIIVVDLLIFLIVHAQRKKKKSGLQTAAVIQKLRVPAPDIKIELPRKSAIYLFGGLRIYDNNGDDIARQFSPLLKELLTLLIITSGEGGISSEKLRDILWSDKSEASARNNRAVNFGKLRTLLALVGEYEISGTNGYWQLSLPGIFSDYKEYEQIAGGTELSRENIFRLLSLTQEGGLLKNADYLWLDKYKGNVADRIIELMSAYAVTLDPLQDSILTEKIADTIFCNDPMNEFALHLKCKQYVSNGNGYMAKALYGKFCKEYKVLYGETYPHLFEQILEQEEFA
ncbi:MAG: hypothetical protein RR346_05605 [Bacteroidales bacterium]